LKPLDDKSLPLNEDMDAARWAREFIEANRYCYVGAERLDEGAMIGWFANAIMCGHDVGRRKLRDELTASPSHEPATDEAQALLDRAYQFVADEQWVRDYTFFCKRKA
jgi:hypothetical protein